MQAVTLHRSPLKASRFSLRHSPKPYLLSSSVDCHGAKDCGLSASSSRTPASVVPMTLRKFGSCNAHLSQTRSKQVWSHDTALALRPSIKCKAVAFGGASDRDVSAAAAASAPAEGIDMADAARTLYKFSRPHTMIGTFISVTSISLLALDGGAMTAAAALGLFQALTSALLMNVSIVGLNQIFDVDIDKINKPDLPLASGEMNMQQASTIVTATAAASLLIGLSTASTALLWTLAISLGLGIVYSTDLPFLRWKRYPVLAAGCILTVRALIVQLGFFHHMKFSLGVEQSVLAPPVQFALYFMLFFSVVIALFKDIPDVAGDTRAGLQTMSVRLGVNNVFWACIGLLTVAYLGAAVFCGLHCTGVKQLVTVGGHLVLCGLLWSKAKQVQLQRKGDIVDYYMFVWKLFYSEYLLLPFL